MVKNVAKGEVALGGTSWCFFEFPDTPVVEVAFDNGSVVRGEGYTEIGFIGMGTFQEDIECFTGGVMGDWANEVLGDVKGEVVVIEAELLDIIHGILLLRGRV